MSKSFETLFCEHYKCPVDEFEDRIFWTCLYRHAVPVAKLVWRVQPAFFMEDRSFLRDLGPATSRGEVLCELNRFYGRNVRDRNWLRKRLAIRISGKRVLRLYRMLFRGAKSGHTLEAKKDSPQELDETVPMPRQR